MIVEYSNEDKYHYMYINEQNLQRVDFVRGKNSVMIVFEISDNIYVFSNTNMHIHLLRTENKEIQDVYELFKAS